MWNVVGIDNDGVRHTCHRCDSVAEAKEKLEQAKEGLLRMRACYADSLINATREYREITRIVARQRASYCDYWGWKMQGFFIERFIIEESKC